MTNYPHPDVLNDARAWLRAMKRHDIADASDRVVFCTIATHYEGGWSAFMEDGGWNQ